MAGLARREVERTVRRTVTPIREDIGGEAQPEVTIDPALLQESDAAAAEDGEEEKKAKPARKPAAKKE